MSRRYNFVHTCGHIGVGPTFDNTFEADIFNIELIQHTISNTTILQLSFACPFCIDTELDVLVETGSGVVAIMASPPDSAFVTGWRIIRACDAGGITPQDRAMAHGEGGVFQQMAWIPRPCGQVTDSNGEGNGRDTRVESSWTQSSTEPVRSRLPGLFSELNALRSRRGYGW